MKSITQGIISLLNESYDPVEAEKTVGTDEPAKVYQCPVCKAFYQGDDSHCPTCNVEGEEFKKVNESEEQEDADNVEKITGQDPIDEEIDEPGSVKVEDEIIVSEALKTLRNGDYKKFNESYSSITSLNKKGELVFKFESCNVTKKITARQRAIYNLSEKMDTKSVTKRSKKNESIKIKRQSLLVKNESRAIKIAATRFLERQNAKYDCQKFNESMTAFLNERFESIRKKLEDIQQDDEIGKEELQNMSSDDIAQVVADVVEDTGLEIIDKDATTDEGDSAVVSIRVEDTPEAEVSCDEIKSVLSDIFDAPVEIEGPNTPDGDSTLADLEVIINPEASEGCDDDEDLDKDLHEDDDEEFVDDDDILDENDDEDDLPPRDDDDEEDEEDEDLTESRKSRKLFVLAESRSYRSGKKIKYLSEDESDAEDENDAVKVFSDEESAEDYIKENDLDGEYVPVEVEVATEKEEEEDDDKVTESRKSSKKKVSRRR